jgi:hypothetical protein
MSSPLMCKGSPMPEHFSGLENVGAVRKLDFTSSRNAKFPAAAAVSSEGSAPPLGEAHAASVNEVKTTGNDIYQQLGWDDEYDDF